MTLAAIPTLDELANYPELARALPQEAAFRLYLRAQSVAMVCALALSNRALARALDETLSTAEAARILGVSPSTLRHGAQTMYKGLRVANGTSRLAWSRQKIERFTSRPVAIASVAPQGVILGSRPAS